MTPDNSTKRFGNIEITFDQDCDDVVSAALAMLAYGISKLPLDKCEERLNDQMIEQARLQKTMRSLESLWLSAMRHKASCNDAAPVGES